MRFFFICCLLFSHQGIATPDAHDPNAIAHGRSFFRDTSAPRVREWVIEQNQRFAVHVAPVKDLSKTIAARVQALQVSGPSTRRIFSRGELHFKEVPQGRELRLKGTDGKDDLIFSTSGLGSSAGFANIVVSPDESKVAIAINYSNTDVLYWYFFDFVSMTLAKAEPIRIRFHALNWSLDSKGVFYTVWPDEEAEKSQMRAGVPRRLHVAYHRVGAARVEDFIVFQNPAPYPAEVWSVRDLVPNRILVAFPEQDGVIQHQRVYVGRMDGKKVSWDLLDASIDLKVFQKLVAQDGSELFFHSSRPGSHFGLTSYRWDRSGSPWRTVIPAHPTDVAVGVRYLGGRFTVVYLRPSFSPYVAIFSRDGRLLKTITPTQLGLPEGGSLEVLRNSLPSRLARFKYEAQNSPTKYFEIDLESLKWARLPSPKEHPYERCLPVQKQVHFVTSLDGRTRVPVQIFLPPGGVKPKFLYLWYYGAIGAIEQAGYSTKRQAILEMGGAVAIVNTRGGAERGISWYRQAAENRFVTLQDIVAVSRWGRAHLGLQSEQVVAEGGSWGGLTTYLLAAYFPSDFGMYISYFPVSDLELAPHGYLLWAFLDDIGFPRSPRTGFRIHHHRSMAKSLHASPVHQAFRFEKPPYLLTLVGAQDDRIGQDQAYYFTKILVDRFGAHAPVYLSENPIGGHGTALEQMTDSLALVGHKYGALRIQPIKSCE